MRGIAMLEVQNLSVSFSPEEKAVVRGMSFSLHQGESLGIVGESGSGKTMAVQSLLRLHSAPFVFGKALFEGEDLLQKSERELQQIRGRKIGMVFQDPLTSLNPTMTIGDQITEGLLHHGLCNRKEAKKQALDWLKRVKVPDPEVRLKQYSHNLSGGMRQRVMIAIALSCQPKLLIADEPTTALDTTTQAQILSLLSELQLEFNMALLLITHDLSIVAERCQRVLVLHEGIVVEEGPVEQILLAPKHPYTQMLLRCIPRIDSCF